MIETLKVITTARAREILDSVIEPTAETETLPLSEARGRILARDVRAKENIPFSERSTVDGYAVKAAEVFGASDAVPAILKLDGEINMGSFPKTPLKKRGCRKIYTGGFLPPGADAAVMLEYTDVLPGAEICVSKPVSPGTNLIFSGDDVKKGELVLARGRRLGPCETGVLAALGESEVEVKRRLKVGLFSTGDEIIETDEPSGPGKIRDVNRAVLRAALQNEGCEVLDYGIASDDEALIERIITEAAKDCDAVIFSGGTSAGARDFAETALNKKGKILWRGLAVKPGKPTLAALVSGKLALALPGHPAAAFLIWRVLGLFAIRKYNGEAYFPTVTGAVLAESVSANDGRETLLPVRLEGGKAFPLRGKSGLISLLSKADGYISIGRDLEGLSAGARVEVVALS